MDSQTIDLKEIRKSILKSCYMGGGHIGGSLSIVEILYVLYKDFINNDKNDFILSKGHAAPGLYSVLRFFSYISKKEYESYGTFGTKLIHHPSVLVNEVRYSSGALGNGLSVGVGMALANKVLKSSKKVFVVMGDGELNEGTAWEGFIYAGSKRITNLVAIIDHNGLQSSDKTNRLIKTKYLIKGIKSLGWKVVSINGHDTNAIKSALNNKYKKPLALVLNTVKGKGVSFMENDVTWHHRKPTEEEYNLAISELS